MHQNIETYVKTIKIISEERFTSSQIMHFLLTFLDSSITKMSESVLFHQKPFLKPNKSGIPQSN